MHNQRILSFALLLWVFSSLLFMAAMSIGLACFFIVAVFCLRSQLSRIFHLKDLYLAASVFLIMVSLWSIGMAYAFPPMGISPEGFFEVKKFQYFLAPIFVAHVLLSLASEANEILKKAEKILVVVAVAGGIAGIFQYWATSFLPMAFLKQHNFFRPMTYGILPEFYASHFHAQGFMQFHLSFATAMFFPLSLAAMRILNGRESFTKRLFLSFAVLLIALAIFYTYSRSAWAALAVWFVLVPIFWRPRLILIVLPLALIGLGVLWNFVPSVQERIRDPMSLDGRKIVWAAALEMAKDRPWSGVGFGKTGQYSQAYAEKIFGADKVWFSSHAHNNVLDALAAGGIPGVAGFLLWWVVVFWISWKVYRGFDREEKIWGGAFLLSAIAFQINGISQVNFYDAKSQHILFLFIGIVLYFYNRKNLAKLAEN